MNQDALRLSLDRGLVKTKSLIARLEPEAARAKKNWSNGVTIPKGKKAMADMTDDEKKKKDEEEAAKKDALADDEPVVDKSETNEPEVEAETETPDEPLDDADADAAPKPGAYALGEMAAAADMILARINELLTQNEKEPVVAHLEKLREQQQAARAEIEESLAAVYPGVKLEDVMPKMGEGDPDATSDPELERHDIDEEMTAKRVKAEVKRLKNAHASVIKDAAEHMEEMGGDERMPKCYKAGCKFHAKALGDMLAEKDKAGDDEPEKKDDEDKEVEREVKRLYSKAKRLVAV